MPSHRSDIRIDFEFTPVEFDEKKQLITLAVKLNPRRYEYQEMDGVKGYYDKFDQCFFPEELVNKVHKNIKGLPIYHSPSKIDDADKYILDRIKNTINFFEKKDDNLNKEILPDSKDLLTDLDNVEMDFVILSIDLKDSTKISQELTPELNAQVISLFLSEMTLLIDKFNGYVLKYTGDGLLAYFPEPNNIGKADNAINCAYLMKCVIMHVINPLLDDNGLPNLIFRIGLDFGNAIVKNIGKKGIKSFSDIIGDTVNIAVKIQDLAEDNQILIGASVAHITHTYWRERLGKYKLPKNWQFKDKVSKRPYKVYYLNDS